MQNQWIECFDGQELAMCINLAHASRLRIFKEHGHYTVSALMPHGYAGEWVALNIFEVRDDAEQFCLNVVNGNLFGMVA